MLLNLFQFCCVDLSAMFGVGVNKIPFLVGKIFSSDDLEH